MTHADAVTEADADVAKLADMPDDQRTCLWYLAYWRARGR